MFLNLELLLSATNVIDGEIMRLTKERIEDPARALRSTIISLLKNGEQKELFKLKEFFLNLCELLPELPKLEKEEVDNFIEVFLQICQRNPSPLASRGKHKRE